MGYRTWAQAWNPGQVTLFHKVFILELNEIGWGRRGRRGAGVDESMVL